MEIGQVQPYLVERLRQTIRNPKPDKELDASESGVVINFGARSLLGALDILGRIGNSSVVPDIQFALNHDGDDVWRRAVTALEAIGSQEALHALLFMYNGDKYVGKRRRSAWRKISTEHLLSVIRNREIDPLTRMEGTWILGDRAEPEALSVLTEILNDETENCIVRGQAAVGLGRLGKFSGLETLVKALREEQEEIASKAAWALGKLGYANGVDALVAALQDDRKGVMQEATKALIKIADAIAIGQIGNDKAVDVLIHTLQDQNPNVRKTAIKALGQIGNDRAVDALIQALQHKDWEVRRSVAEVLWQIGHDTAIDVLGQALQDPHSNVREYAVEALRKIGNATAVVGLNQALRDENSALLN